MIHDYDIPLMPEWPKGANGFQIPMMANPEDAEEIRKAFVYKNELLPEQVRICPRQGEVGSFVTHYLVIDKVEIK
jgi:hypothetical protein